jgi:hypothetical protein
MEIYSREKILKRNVIKESKKAFGIGRLNFLCSTYVRMYVCMYVCM